GTVSGTFTIGKAEPTYTAPIGLTATYGDTLMSVALPAGWEWIANTSTLVGDVGQQTHKARFTPDDLNNYEIVEDIDVEITVSPKDITGATVTVTGTYTYTGAAHTPAPTVTLAGFTPTYDTTYSNNTNAGTATVTVTGSGNFTGTASGTFIIGKAEQTGFQINEVSNLSYGDKPFLQLTTYGGQGSDEVTWRLTSGNAVSISEIGIMTIEKAGTVTVTATKAGDGNYNDVTASLTLTVGKRDIKDVIANISGEFTYTGLAHIPKPAMTDGSDNLITADDWEVKEYKNNISAGTASVVIAATENGNYTGTITVEFAIGKAPLTVTAENKTIEFNQAPPTYTYTLAGFQNGETATSAGVQGIPDFTVAYTTGNPVGSYDIVITIGSLQADNYDFVTFNNGTLSVGLTGQAPLSVTNAPTTITYGDVPFTLATSGGDGNGAVTYTVTGGDGALSVDAGGIVTILKAGTSIITATKAGDGNYNPVSADITLTVWPKSITLSDISINSVIYNGSAQSPNIIVSDNGTTLTGGADYTAGLVSETDAGEYTVTIQGIGSYTGTASGKFIIGKEDLTVEADDTTVVYDTQPTFTVTYTGFVGGETADVLTGTLVYSGYSAGQGVGTYTITPSGLASQNYEITFVAGTLTIEPKNIADATVTVGGAFVYTGAAHTPTPTVTLAGFAPTYDTAYSDNTNAGTATVTVTGTGNFTGEVSRDFTIGKAPLTVTAENKAVSYGDPAPSYTAVYSGFVNGETESILNGTLALECDYTSTSNVSEYPITPSGLTSENYEITFIAGTLTVAPQNITDATVTVDGTFVYTGAAHTPTPTVTLVGFDPAYDTSYSNNTNAGTATVTVTGTGNFTGTASGTFTIGKAEPTYTTPPNLAATYGDTLASVTLDDGWEWIANTSTLVGDVGQQTHKARFTPDDLSNYEIVENIEIVIAVSPKAVTITGLSAADKVYDGDDTATITGTPVIVGNIDGADLNVSQGTASFADADAGADKHVEFSGFALSGTAAGNYELPQQPASATAEITQKSLTLTVTNTALVFTPLNGEREHSVGMSVGGLVGSDTASISFDSGSAAGFSFIDSNTINYDGSSANGDTRHTFTFTADAGGNYITAEDTLTVDIYDGQAATGNRPIPVNQDNIAAARTYLNANLSRHFVQTENITLSSAWTAISGTFTGSYDGGGNSISGLSGSRAMFTQIGTTGAVRNLGLVNLNINNTTTTLSDVGGIAGTNSGTIERCYVAGTVRSDNSNVTGTTGVGGIAGVNNGTIQRSYSLATVSGTRNVGGIAGNHVSGKIENCYAAGNVSTLTDAANANYYVGGIVGRNEGSISNCYATGNIHGGGTSGAAGIAGRNTGSSCFVENCVALGLQITGNATNMGRVAGEAMTNYYMSNNFARTMDGTSNDSNPNGRDGQTIDSSQYSSAAWWASTTNGPGWSSSIWTFTNGVLPTLTGLPGQTPIAPSASPLTIDFSIEEEELISEGDAGEETGEAEEIEEESGESGEIGEAEETGETGEEESSAGEDGTDTDAGLPDAAGLLLLLPFTALPSLDKRRRRWKGMKA
ncbi:MAG: YDG domain-containing protein, partial [Oscillospiraceae bacterium]|nr:YDG domain-containing protein [Oscillospiraceae bacterium]